MFKTLSLTGAALLMGATALAPAAADAQRYGGYDRGYSQGYDTGYGRGAYSNYNGYNGYRDDGRGYRDDGRGYSGDTRGYARCNNGTGGTIIGAIAGGLLGRTIDTRGDRTLGTVLGAGAGALAGNAIGRSGNPGYCRR